MNSIEPNQLQDKLSIPTDLMERVRSRVDEALDKNNRIAVTVTILLSILFLTGVTLILTAAILQNVAMGLTGGILEIAIVFPIRMLLELRREDIRLQFIPELVQMAAELGKDEKQMLFRAVVKLIEEMAS